MKKLIVLLAIILTFSACGTANNEAEKVESTASETVSETSKEAETTASSTTETTELTLTIDDLKKYDGKDGNPAYIAVDGIIYDVTNDSNWSDGEHNGFKAGQDLTNDIKNASPHGIKALENIPVVGKLV